MVVAHKTLVSAPVPIGIGIRGLGLGRDNILVFLLFSFLLVIVTKATFTHILFSEISSETHRSFFLIMFRLLLNLNIPFRSQSLEPAWVSSSPAITLHRQKAVPGQGKQPADQSVRRYNAGASLIG